MEQDLICILFFLHLISLVHYGLATFPQSSDYRGDKGFPTHSGYLS